MTILKDIAGGRSGDKGPNTNIGLVFSSEKHYLEELLQKDLSNWYDD